MKSSTMLRLKTAWMMLIAFETSRAYCVALSWDAIVPSTAIMTTAPLSLNRVADSPCCCTQFALTLSAPSAS